MSKSGTLRKVIGPLKRRLEDNVAKATTLLQKVIPSDLEAAHAFLNDVELVVAKLNTSVNSLQDRDQQWADLIQKLDGAALEAEEQIYEQTASAEGGYIDMLEEGKELINILGCKQKNIERMLQPLPSSAVRSSDDVSAANRDTRRSTSAKLPKLDLPYFSGCVHEWQHFWTVFAANVDNTELTGVEKFSYLRSRVKGIAMDAIGGLPITDDAYKVALDILKDRFQRSPEEMVCSLYGQLKRLPIASTNVADLRRTFDSCEKILRQLKDANEDTDSNRSLVLDVLSKYPEQIIKQLTHRKMIRAQSTLLQVQSAIKEYIEETDSLSGMLQDLQPFHRDSSSKSNRNRPSDYNRPNSDGSLPAPRPNHANSGWDRASFSTALTATASQSSGASNNISTPKSPCYFCADQHFNSQCERFRSADARFKRLAVVGRCQRCMDSSHTTHACRTYPSRIRCHFCRSTGVHVSALCPGKFGGNASAEPHLTSGVKVSYRRNLAKSCDKSKTIVKSDEKSKSSQDHTADGQAPQPTLCGLSVQEQALLSTAIATIRNPATGAERPVRVILDNGCPRTFILESVAQQLDLKVKPSRELYISSFGSKRSVSHPTLQVQFDMCLRDGQVMSIESNTVEIIVNRSAQPESLPPSTQRITETMGRAMADTLENQGPPEVLIGSDYFWQLITCDRMTTEDGIFLIPSSLGLLLGGRFKPDEYSSEYPALLCLTERSTSSSLETNLSALSSISKLRQPYPDIDDFWDLERIGISDSPVENDDEVAQRQFDESVYFEDGRYQVSWPWKETRHQLPTNYSLAVGRLRSLAKRLSSSDSTIGLEYDKTIKDQLQRGIIEKVPQNERFSKSNTVHYLPHHPVVRTGHNTTKVRIVYDASSKCRKDQMSLNECLYRGPVILPDLCSILIRFRLNTIAIAADVEKAFLQLGLQKSQRDVTRFLWFTDPTNPEVDGNIEIYRFKRVPFGAISSPFLLGATLQHHLKQIGTNVATEVRGNIYVDNVISGTKTETDAINFYDESKRIFEKASMNLREWCSNSPTLQHYIPAIDRCAKQIIKVLGLTWDCRSDLLSITNQWMDHKNCTTKRAVLTAIASVYDPLGLFQPCTLKAKCFLRDLWNINLGWDDELEVHCQIRWKAVHNDIAPIFEVKIPRQVTYADNDADISLAVFSDASKEAYATAVYVRARDRFNNNRWSSNLIYSKSRLTPKLHSKSISLPRLELLGLTIGVRAVQFVRSSLQRSTSVPCYVFCDSVCVLSWIRTEKPLQKFVGNRVKQIQSLLNAEYHHVSSSDNPADLCTRGLPGGEISTSSFWWHGPRWLDDESSKWPTNKPIEVISDIEFLKETKSEPSISLLVGDAPDSESTHVLGIDASDFSCLRTLLRVSTRCMKFLKAIWNRTSKKTQENHPNFTDRISAFSDSSHITSGDLAHIKVIWVKAIQSSCFPDVITAIQSKSHHQLMNQLNLKIDSDGLIRCFGRLTNADLPQDAATPVLLPKDASLTKLIIENVHQKLFHSGISHTLSQLRRQFWVPQGRNIVRRVINRCIVCRKMKGAPFALPDMPPWPRERVARSRPFQFSGVDYLGPVNVKLPDGNSQKMWCCLFTCLAVRAVHLECVTNCTAQSFMECLSRFVARRGCPEEIISDNAPQFRLAKTTLDRSWHRVMTDDIIRSYVADNGIRWKFTTELAPWQGGVYERLVGVVKSTFKSMIGRRFLRWDEFMTLIAETEAIVNSRPITYVSSDIESCAVLRPMDFIVELPTGTPCVEPNVRPLGGDATKFLLMSWKAKQKRLDAIWRQWYDEYLLSLRERYQLSHKSPRSKISEPPKEGEIVIIKNTEAPRGHWKLGQVINLIPSNDGSVRSAEIKLPSKLIIRRPLNHLYRLEIPDVINEADPARQSPVTPDVDPIDDETAEESFHGFHISEVEAAERAAAFPFSRRSDGDQIRMSALITAGHQNMEGSLSMRAAPILFK